MEKPSDEKLAAALSGGSDTMGTGEQSEDPKDKDKEGSETLGSGKGPEAKSTAELAKEKAKQRFESIVGLPKKAWKGITGKISKVVGGFFGRSKDAVIGLGTKVLAADVYAGAAKNSAQEKVEAFLGDLAGTIERAAPDIEKSIRGKITTVGNEAKKAGGDLGEGLTQAVKEGEEKVAQGRKNFGEFLSSVSDTLDKNLPGIALALQTLIDSRVQNVRADIEKGAREIVGAIETVATKLYGEYNKAREKMSQRREKVFDAIRSGWKWCLSRPEAGKKLVVQGVEKATGVAELRARLEEEGKGKLELLAKLEQIQRELAKNRLSTSKEGGRGAA